jgi:hypothetical protein
MTTLIRSFVTIAAVVFFARPVLAGPPLICHPFEVEGGNLIAWGTGAGWNTPDRSYEIKRLVADTTAVLTPDAPILTRMENMRRATIYAMRDPVIANELLKALTARALATTTDSRAWFDAGYLIESYRQMKSAGPWEMLAGTEHLWADFRNDPRAVDGYGFVRKALRLAGSNAEMEFAASLMQQGTSAAQHRQRAAAGAPAGSLLARNLANVGR